MAETATTDRDFVARWVEESSAREAFWRSSPRWTSGSARRECEGRLLVFTPQGILDVPPAPAVVAAHLDGLATLEELLEDLAAVAEVPVEGLRPMVASLAVELQAWGALEGVDVTAPPADDEVVSPAGDGPLEYTVVDPETGAEVRVEEGVDANGNRMVTEHLPGGLRRVTSYLTYQTGDGDLAATDAEDLAAALLAGDRSAAELVPVDSCLGAKLRNEESVPLVGIRCPDGQVRSVRCHDPEVAIALAAAAGDQLVADGERGPIEAFVVTPLEGDGPLRIYDGRGKRRGRPRSTAEAVDVVDQVLGEASARRAEGPDAAVLLDAVLAVQGDRGLLVGPDLADTPAFRRALTSGGWSVGVGRALAVSGPGVTGPSVFGGAPVVSPEQVRLVPQPEEAVPPAMVVPHLIDTIPPGVEGDDVLDRLIAIATWALAPASDLELPGDPGAA